MDVTGRIMQATVHLVESAGFNAVTVVDVAARAGVSRQTVYTNFGSRENLVSVAMQRVAAQMLEDITADVAGTTTAAEFLLETFVSVRTQVGRHPALSQLALSQNGSALMEGQLFASVALPMAQHFLAPVLDRAPELTPQFDELCEVCLRLGLSILMFESPGTRSTTTCGASCAAGCCRASGWADSSRSIDGLDTSV